LRPIDADNHYYETRDAFTRHIEARHAERTLRVLRDASGEERMWLDGRPYTYVDPKYDRTNPPGLLAEILRNKGNATWKDSYSAEQMRPAYVDREARLALLNEQGLDRPCCRPRSRSASSTRSAATPS
jgi:hypothetical protein